MKSFISPISIVLFLAFLSMQTAFTKPLATSSTQYTESEAKIFTELSKLTACASKPLNEKCPKCINPGNGYKFYFFYQTTRINKFNYKFMIHYNDILKKILVTFSGPSVNEHVYIKYIYSAGFSLVKKYNFQIEKEFYEIYFNKLRKILYQKLKKIKSSGRKAFQTYFVGHSIGGSLATLAAFDMQKSKALENIKVFSLAPMRLGDASYVTMVNSYVTVYRIVKKSDYLVRIPNCYYSTTYKVWRCFNEKIVKQFILKPNFPLKTYVSSYLTYYTKANSILRDAIIYARKRLSLSNAKKTSLKKTPLKKISRKNRNNKKRISKTKPHKKHALSKSHKKHALRKLHKKQALSKAQNKKTKKALTLKDLMKKLNKSVKTSEKTLKKYNPKKIQKSARKISKQLKKYKKRDIGKLSFKKLKKLIKYSKKLNGRKIRRNPRILKRRINRFLRRVKKIAKRIFRRAEKLLQSPTPKKHSIKSRSRKARKTLRKNRKNKNSRKNRHAKKQTKKGKDSKKNKKTKVSPIKKLANKNQTKKEAPKTYIFIPSKFINYTPFQTYFQFVYYTQPIGYQIFYNDSMTEYTTCQYLNGISLCEKVVELPLQFTTVGHMTYFGVDFDKC
jgi:hypothetical protein